MLAAPLAPAVLAVRCSSQNGTPPLPASAALPPCQGPKPLLLSTVTTDDLAILLSWSDAATSQVGGRPGLLLRSRRGLLGVGCEAL